ncbi:MAG: hypothetical protein AAB731_00295, partial [Patescibacteria group bacterium]
RLPNYKKWSAERLNFKVSDKNFSARGNGADFSQLDFKIKNSTAYGYWNLDAAILLSRGSALQGVNFISLNKFLSGEERAVSLVWKDSGIAPTEIEVLPSVNIFDPGAYMPVR